MDLSLGMDSITCTRVYFISFASHASQILVYVLCISCMHVFVAFQLMVK